MYVTLSRIELWKVDRIRTRRARPAPERVLDHEGPGHFLPLEELEDVWLRLRVVLADTPAAEAADAHGAPATVPAVQSILPSAARSGRRPAEAYRVGRRPR